MYSINRLPAVETDIKYMHYNAVQSNPAQQSNPIQTVRPIQSRWFSPIQLRWCNSPSQTVKESSARMVRVGWLGWSR